VLAEALRTTLIVSEGVGGKVEEALGGTLTSKKRKAPRQPRLLHPDSSLFRRCASVTYGLLDRSSGPHYPRSPTAAPRLTQ
jgi:hypothetical protein